MRNETRKVRYRCACGEVHELVTRLRSRLHWDRCPHDGEWNRVSEEEA